MCIIFYKVKINFLIKFLIDSSRSLASDSNGRVYVSSWLLIWWCLAKLMQCIIEMIILERVICSASATNKYKMKNDKLDNGVRDGLIYLPSSSYKYSRINNKSRAARNCSRVEKGDRRRTLELHKAHQMNLSSAPSYSHSAERNWYLRTFRLWPASEKY